jgi:hypothetical protein
MAVQTNRGKFLMKKAVNNNGLEVSTGEADTITIKAMLDGVTVKSLWCIRGLSTNGTKTYSKPHRY